MWFHWNMIINTFFFITSNHLQLVLITIAFLQGKKLTVLQTALFIFSLLLILTYKFSYDRAQC